jgi:serine phosphatase RsbU (regulator of sigma subunit)/GAF domain-containing protein/anti-sigma regulatory factor (Ser/Thr protein kinase)
VSASPSSAFPFRPLPIRSGDRAPAHPGEQDPGARTESGKYRAAVVAVDPADDAVASRWRAAVLSAPVGMATFRGDRCVAANPAFVALLGRPAGSDVAGLDLAALFGHRAASVLAPVVEQVLTLSAPSDVEVGVDDCPERWLVAKWFPAGDADEPLAGVVLIDVSGRHHGDEQHVALQHLTAEFAAAVTPEAVADVVIRAVLASVGASGGALYLVDADASRLVAVESRYPWDPGGPLLDVAIDEEIPVSTAARLLQPVWISDLDELRERFPATPLSDAASNWSAHAALPLQLGTEVLGAMVFSWAEPRRFGGEDRSFLQVVAEQCSLALARASAFHRERSAREHIERAADHVLRLERITGALAVASEPEDVVARFLDECLAELGASVGAVLVVDADGDSLVPMASRSEVWTPAPVPLGGQGPLVIAAQSRHTVLLADLAEIHSMVAEPRAPAAPEQAWAVVPLVAYGELLGVTAIRYDGAREFDADDRAFLDRVGRRLAEALERSRLYAHQRDAREQAEAAARWLRSVQSLAASLARSATRRDVARALREHLHPATRADFSLVAALSADRRSLDVLTGTASFAMSTSTISVSVERAVRDSIMRGRGVELDEPGAVRALFPHLAEQGVEAFALLPIRTGHRVIGVIGMGWTARGGLSADARRLLAIAVSLGGAAFERAAAYDLDHHIAETLQRHLLTPPELDAPGLLWAARYAPGRVELTAGGDWYDVIPLPDRRVALVVGDIVGHGVVAAAAMGQVRSATRALAVREGAVGVLEALDAYVTTTGQGNLSSMAVVVLDPETGAVEYAIAGHPPPLLRTPDGSVTFVEDARGPLLGIAPPGVRRSVRRVIPPGSTIVLYTDGLVERRGESIDVGLARLATAVSSTPQEMHPEGLCDRLLDQLDAGRTASDDITVLAITFQPVERRRVQAYPARLDMLRVIRTELRTWLTANEIEPVVADDVVLACDEVCANAFEQRTHASRPDSIELDLRAEDDEVVLSITDAGEWIELTTSAPPIGRMIVGALMEDVQTTSHDGSITLTMRRRRPSAP